jgi:hypothetical protein
MSVRYQQAGTEGASFWWVGNLGEHLGMFKCSRGNRWAGWHVLVTGAQMKPVSWLPRVDAIRCSSYNTHAIERTRHDFHGIVTIVPR